MRSHRMSMLEGTRGHSVPSVYREGNRPRREDAGAGGTRVNRTRVLVSSKPSLHPVPWSLGVHFAGASVRASGRVSSCGALPFSPHLYEQTKWLMVSSGLSCYYK